MDLTERIIVKHPTGLGIDVAVSPKQDFECYIDIDIGCPEGCVLSHTKLIPNVH